tara:strand:- start:521 stop:715 length:195 start_codon:yes stop_codon:yes gene_type:complete
LYKLKKGNENMNKEIEICPECGTQVEAPIDAICSDCQADQNVMHHNDYTVLLAAYAAAMKEYKA